MLNLGGLFFTLDADTRGLMNAQRRVEAFANTTRQAFRGVGRGTVAPQFANQLARQERAVISMMERIKAFQSQVASTRIGKKSEAVKILEDLGRQYDNFTRKMAAGVPLNTLDFGRRVQHMTSQINDARRAFTALNSEASRKHGLTNFSGILQGLGSSALVVQGHFGGFSTRLFALRGIIQEVGVVAGLTAASVAGLSAGVGLLAVSAVKAGKELQQIQAALTAVTGNAAVAQQHIGFVRDVADQAGLVFNDAAKGYTRFLASADGVLSLKQTQDVFRGISLAASTMQLSVEDTQGVFRALDQMLSKGTVQAEELRGQMGDRLPGAFKIAAAAMGVTTRELNKMMKDGEVVSSEFVPKFVATLQRMFNIDPSKDIQTLQASLNRLTNEWTYFGQELNKATNATRVYQSIVDMLSRSLQSASIYLPEIISGLAGLAGGLASVAAIMAVVSAWPTVIAAVSAAWAGVNTFLIAVRGSTLSLAAAQLLLGQAMNAIPLMRIVGLLALLTAGLGGAKLAYDAVNSAIQQNMSSLSNTSAIESYIDAQKRMGFQIRATTQDMLNQVAAQAMVSAKRAKDIAAEFRDTTKNGGRSIGDWWNWANTPIGDDWATFKGGPNAQRNKRRQQLLQDFRAAEGDAKKQLKLFKELQEVMKLPAPTLSGSVGGTEAKGGKGAKLSDEINQVEDYILRLTRAEERMRALSSGDRQYKLVDDLFKAKEALNQLNPKQLSAVDQALRAAGYTSGELDTRLAAVFTRTRQAEEAARVFTQVWDDLAQGAINLERLNKQLQYIRNGGDPRNLVNFEAFARASDMLRDLDATSRAGQEALAGMQRRLKALGIETIDTGNILEDTKAALAAFFQQEDQGERLVRVLSDIHEQTRNLKDRLFELNALQANVGGTSLGGLFGDPAESERATKEAIARGQAVRDLVREMSLAGASQEEINQKASEYLQLLRQVDEASNVYDRLREKVDQNRDALRGMLRAGTDGFRDLISGAKSFGDVMLDILNNVLDKMWERFINIPIDDFLNGLGRKKDKAATSGLDASVAAIPTLVPANDNAGDSTSKAVDALGAAALSAAGAVNGSFIGAIAQGAAQALAAIGIDTAKTAATTASTAAETQNVVATVTGTIALRALTSSAAAAAVALSTISTGGGKGGKGGIIGSVVKGIASIFGKTQTAATGGKIVGAGTGTSDSIFAMIDGVKPLFVSNGESIVTAAATRKYWPLIDAMNKGRLPSFVRSAMGLAGGGVAGDSDYMLPLVSSYMSPTSAISGGGTTYIDASGDINVNGNVGPDELAALRREMRAREKRIAAMIPGRVDARMLDNKIRRPAYR